MTEKEWDAALFNAKRGLAPTLGWRSFHVLRSKGSASGFPDRTLYRERVIFAELKRDAKAKPTPSQREWLTGLAKAGAEVYLWRPADMDEIGKILGRRWKFDGNVLWQTVLPKAIFQPDSLWLPSGSRTDEA